ncbi:MAG: transposase family protein [Oscillospiraceae bacterium]|nr:transposase family protein [Oscillospiraceae bacterium]
MKYEQIQNYTDAQFRRITGVKRAAFEKMPEILTVAHAEKHRRRGRNPKLCMQDRLLAALEYRREYRTFAHIAASYGVSESNISKQFAGLKMCSSRTGRSHCRVKRLFWTKKRQNRR